MTATDGWPVVSRRALACGTLVTAVLAVLFWTTTGDPGSAEPLRATPAPDTPQARRLDPMAEVPPLAIPDERVPETPPRFVPSRHQFRDAEEARLEGLAASPDGPKAADWVREQQGVPFSVQTSQASMAEWLDIHELPQMLGLQWLSSGLRDVQLTAGHAGLPKTEAAFAARANQLDDLGYDGEVAPALVQAHACALTHVEATCPLDARGCSSYRRLGRIAALVCADPLTEIPEDLRRSSAAFR